MTRRSQMQTGEDQACLFAAYLWFACDFGWAGDPSFCGWTSEKDSSFKWQIQSSGTPTLNTGPNMDHTGEDEERRGGVNEPERL